MAGLKDYSTTPASNATVGSVNFAENQAPSSVNDSARQLMADLRTWRDVLEWRDWGHTVTYATATTFTVSGDQTAIYTAGRPIQCTDATTLYGYVSASSYSTPNTTVTVVLFSGSLSASLSAVLVGWDAAYRTLPAQSLVLNSLTEDTGPDATADFVLTYDASADANKKVTPTNIVDTVITAGTYAASQAQQEAGSSTAVYVTPGVAQYHPSACKCWVKFDNAGTVDASYNVTSITDSGIGNWAINIATDFSSALYGAVVSMQQTSDTSGNLGFGAKATFKTTAPTAGIIYISGSINGGDGQYDLISDSGDSIFAAMFGDQA